MRKLYIVLLVLIAMIGVLVAPATLAQETTVSTGCSGLASAYTISGSSFTGSFSAGESITFSVNSDFASGDTYTVTVGGVAVVTNHDQPTYTHTFAANVTSVQITVTVTSGTFIVIVVCDQASEAQDFTLCHIPPGNPAAAHTIRVGSQNAFDTHINNHGDTPGACPEGVNSRADDFAGGLVIYIILNNNPDINITQVINIWGACDDGECESLVEISIDVVVVLVGSLNIGQYVEFDADDDDGYTVRIYYLGYQDRNGDGISQNVFQINIYFNNVLTNDDVLILIGDDGSISWTLNPDLGVDISILFSGGSNNDTVDECDADGADDVVGTDDDEVCEDDDATDDTDGSS